jgi:anti-sigma-K factor RskA
MSLKDIISSGLLESYVLGTASAEETAMINDLCKKHPELLLEIESIESSLINYAETNAPNLDAKIKTKLNNEITNQQNNPVKVIPLPKKNTTKLRLFQFGMAASTLLFITSMVYVILLQQQVGKLNGELSELNLAKSFLAQEIKIQQTSISSINQRLQIVTAPGVKCITLNGMNSLSNKAAMLYWNSKTEDVYFNSLGLPESPAAKQYQLWAIVDGKPVDVGLIDLSASNLVFQKMKSVKGATAFAVTIEKIGGNGIPSMETMCLLGNV